MRRIPWLNLLLFVATFVTTTLSGARLAGETGWQPAKVWAAGWSFSVPLLLILVAHEMGHYVVARRHGLKPSWPYFIPVPPPFLGTLGAVIRMRPRWAPTRAQLFDVGIAGPLAGFVVACGVMATGLLTAQIDPRGAELQTQSLVGALLQYWETGSTEGFLRSLGGPIWVLGDSLLVQGLAWLLTGHSSAQLVLGSAGFAGWVGLFLTMLNLFPIGQLDGGHVAYALLGSRARRLPWLVLPMLLVLGFAGWPGWFVWAMVVTLLGLRHPPAIDAVLGPGRLALAWGCLVIFLLIFTPVPMQPAW